MHHLDKNSKKRLAVGLAITMVVGSGSWKSKWQSNLVFGSLNGNSIHAGFITGMGAIDIDPQPVHFFDHLPAELSQSCVILNSTAAANQVFVVETELTHPHP